MYLPLQTRWGENALQAIIMNYCPICKTITVDSCVSVFQVYYHQHTQGENN